MVFSFVRRLADKGAQLTTNGYDPDCPRDVVADLCHYCASIGIDPEEEVARGIDHYLAEATPQFDGLNEDGDRVESFKG